MCVRTCATCVYVYMCACVGTCVWSCEYVNTYMFSEIVRADIFMPVHVYMRTYV